MKSQNAFHPAPSLLESLLNFLQEGMHFVDDVASYSWVRNRFESLCQCFETICDCVFGLLRAISGYTNIAGRHFSLPWGKARKKPQSTPKSTSIPPPILIGAFITSASVRLRVLNVAQLRALDKRFVILDNDKVLAVLPKYEHFLVMQERMPEEE